MNSPFAAMTWGSGKFVSSTGTNDGCAFPAAAVSASAVVAARRNSLDANMAQALSRRARNVAQANAIRAERQPDGQQGAEHIVAAGAGMKGMEEQLRLPVEPRRDRRMA